MKSTSRLVLFDVGNTNTHIGLADGSRIIRQSDVPTGGWFDGTALTFLKKLILTDEIRGAAVCSVVPRATPRVLRAVKQLWKLTCLELRPETLVGVGIQYPRPKTIGPDRLANALAARQHYGAPVVVVDFGTAVTFDVVSREGNYVGGIIAPGLAAMTDYLHEKTALLPRIKIREVHGAIGKSTEKAMLVGAVHGYRGLVRELVLELKRELKVRRLPVVATGGYARLMAAGLPEITHVEPALTLEGLRLLWERHNGMQSSSLEK